MRLCACICDFLKQYPARRQRQASAVYAVEEKYQTLKHKNLLFETLRESSASVLPIVLIVAVLCFIWVPMQTDLMLAFVIGAVFLVVGMGLFTLGSSLSMTQIGSHIGACLTKSRKIWLILSVSFLLGAAVTVSEPDLKVLAASVPAVDTTVLILVVSVGVGFFLLVSMVRILRAISLKWLLAGCYTAVFVLALLADRDFLAVAFDSGGVTTGPMTVPFIMALGVGVASIRSDVRAHEDSFGLVGLCSVGPIFAVLILGFIYRASPEGSEASAVISYADTVAMGHGYLRAIPENLKEVGIALLPIALIFTVFQIVSLRLKRFPLLKILIGVVITLTGLTLFLTGVNVGFSSLGYMLGERLSAPKWRFLLIPLSMLMGWFIINAEPAVQVLNRQVEEMSSGVISARAMGLSLSIAVSCAMGLSMMRALTGLSILWVVLPGYLLAICLSFCVPNTFTAIAFDSGGVASGPLTAAFMLPFATGAVSALGGNIMTDAFGLVALVAMMPLITVQVMGLIYVWSTRRKAAPGKLTAQTDSEVIELWEM
ncbi:MAG: DUF1538 domain-containing protein [Clostridia bacterium]|nr:DUF1538 domain-containing protein [Clostridia bacterium]